MEGILLNIAELRERVSKDTAKRLNLKQLEKVGQRLVSFSGDCRDCHAFLLGLGSIVESFLAQEGHLEQEDLQEYKSMVEQIVSHMEKEHGLVSDGHYVGIYISLGLSFGLILGLAVFDNVALGLPLGLSVGVAIGAGLDADAKKKGKVL